MDMTSPEDAQEIDLLYIDMMIPHHASIIALSQAALPRLHDERLRTLAEAVVTAQSSEIDELRGYRLAFYGSAEPEPLDEHGMMQLMGDSTQPMDEMMAEMDTAAQLAAFCAATDPDLAFIDLTIPHHASAIITSQVVVAEAAHPEIRAFAERVIEVQQREIDELRQIRAELAGAATPEATPAR